MSKEIPYERSFASSSKAQHWSEKNGNVKPRDVYKSANKKFWFLCNICNHEFESSLNNVTNQGRWCSYCVNQKLCEDDNCTICFEKSFASHNKVQFWSNKNKLNPRNVFINSNNKYLFNCSVCNHQFDTKLDKVNKGNWCPYCSNTKLCNDENCNLCFQKSFMSHPQSKFWSKKNGNITPRNVFLNSHSKYWFDCNKCKNSFEKKLDKINTHNQWCPFCVNKTETKLYELLQPLYSSFERQFKVDWCKKQNNLPFDFVIKDYKIIIELDGEQHFKQVSNWKSPEIVQERDIYKMKCANENGYSVIRLLQDDVWNDKYNWLDELKKSINRVINEKKVQNIIMCKNNEYDTLKQSIDW